MDAQRLDEVEQWVGAYGGASRDVEAGVVAAVWAAYATLGDWYDPRQTVAAAAEAVGVVNQMLGAVDGLVATFQSNVTGILAARTLPRPAHSGLEYPRIGVEPRAVYDRPVWTYRDTIARGGSETEAFLAARMHAELLAGTDALLAKRDATAVAFRAHGIQKYRRVIRPELSESGVCGLCIAASQQVYGVEQLLPIHERCKCASLPILKGNDPAASMNSVDLEQLYGDAGGKSRGDLTRTRYRVDRHGELGAVLVPRKAKPVAKAAAWDDPVRAQKELSALLPVLASLEARAASGEDVSGPLGYQRDRIAKLRGVIAA